MFLSAEPPFVVLKIAFFFKDSVFCRGKVAFKFNPEAFLTNYASALQQSITSVFDPEKLHELARKNGFLRRQSKLKPEEFIDTLLFSGFDHSQLSLQECCNDLAQQGKQLSKVALHKRFNSRSLDFLKSVLAEQMASRVFLEQTNRWYSFARVIISDSTKIALAEQFSTDYPGFGGCRGGASLMNIQYAYDLKQGDWEYLDFTKVTQNDQGYSKKTLQFISKDDLHIRDLGYITKDYLAEVVAQEAFFINRLPPKWKPVDNLVGRPIDWTALYSDMKRSKQQHFETTVTIGSSKAAFSCRLIAVAVPEQVWTERIRKAQKQAKSYGCQLSDEYKERCRFSVFITNVNEHILKSEHIIELYGLRWQIERIFKTWKSLLGIDKTKAVKKERLECQLIARFIWILINWKIFWCIDTFIQKTSAGYACSAWKFFKQVRNNSQTLRKVATGGILFADWMELLVFPVIRNLLVEPKKGKKAAFSIVNDIFTP